MLQRTSFIPTSWWSSRPSLNRTPQLRAPFSFLLSLPVALGARHSQSTLACRCSSRLRLKIATGAWFKGNSNAGLLLRHTNDLRPHARTYGSSCSLGEGLRWLPAGLRDLDTVPGTGLSSEKDPEGSSSTPPAGGTDVLLCEGMVPGRLLRVRHQLPGRRYRWSVTDTLGQEWRISTGSVRFAMGGVFTLPPDSALADQVVAGLQQAAEQLVQSAQEEGRVAALWEYLIENGVETPSPADVRTWLWPESECEHGGSPGQKTKDEHSGHSHLSLPASSASSREASKLYAAHRILNENYEYFARVNGEYRTRTRVDRERVEVEKRLFDLKSKEHLLFLLRIDKMRRARREQRRSRKAGSTPPAAPAAEHDEREVNDSELPTPEGKPVTHVTHLPAGFSMDVNAIRPLLSPAELTDADWWDPHKRDALRFEFLKQYALTADFANSTSPYVRDAVLKPLGYRASSGDAFSCLVELGLFDGFANLHQLRATHLGIQDLGARHLSLGAPGRAASYRQSSEQPNRRTDVRYHTVYTIDDASTTEVDDGISVEWQAGNNWVYVHVADPTHSISVDDEVDRYARDRVSTIYLPETTVPMMQPSVYRHFSLEPMRDNHSMTFAFRISSVDGAVEDYTIYPSIISRVKKLSYRQVDDVLASSEPAGQVARPFLSDKDREALHRLHELALLRKRWRLSQGAQALVLPKPLVKVINTPHMKRVSVSLEEQMTPARELVAEMMIAANQVAGLYAAQHGLCLPYRHQAPPHQLNPELLAELEGLPEHIRFVELARHMQAADISLVPTRHTSLGLDAYVQVTSPIRRFADMIAHRQLAAHLSHTRPPYTAETLSVDYLPHIQQRLQHIKELVKQTTSFWVLQNFMRTSRQAQWEALVIRIEEDSSDRYPNFLIQAHFVALGWSRIIHLPRRPHRGELLQLKVQHVSPYSDSITFKEIQA